MSVGDTVESVTIAYHPVKKTVVEVWSVDSTLFAKLPNGDVVEERSAEEIFTAILQSDEVLLYEVSTSRKRRYWP